MFALYVALVCARLPSVVWNGRFYAEEGEFFFAYAWRMPWWRALFHSFGGYLNIVASGATLLDADLVKNGWLALEHAPYLTEAVALLFQSIPAALILTSRATWLRPKWATPLALLVIVTPPLSEEVWLQTLHSQFHLALCAAIILATEVGGSRILRVSRFALLLLGPLCGPAAIVMLPFLGLRALVERNRERWLQTAALALGAAIQIGLFFRTNGERSYHIDASMLATVMLLRHVVMPFLGPVAASHWGHAVYRAAEAGSTPWETAGLGVAALGGWALITVRRWREPAAWLVVPALALAVVSYYGAIHGGPRLLDPQWAMRYGYVPQAMLGLSLVAFAATRRPELARRFVLAPVWLAVIGLMAYFQPTAKLARGPDWRTEVAAWRVDPQHRLATWPDGYWLMDLSPTMTPCSDDIHAPGQPDYCDGYWDKL